MVGFDASGELICSKDDDDDDDDNLSFRDRPLDANWKAALEPNSNKIDRLVIKQIDGTADLFNGWTNLVLRS